MHIHCKCSYMGHTERHVQHFSHDWPLETPLTLSCQFAITTTNTCVRGSAKNVYPSAQTVYHVTCGKWQLTVSIIFHSTAVRQKFFWTLHDDSPLCMTTLRPRLLLQHALKCLPLADAATKWKLKSHRYASRTCCFVIAVAISHIRYFVLVFVFA